MNSTFGKNQSKYYKNTPEIFRRDIIEIISTLPYMEPTDRIQPLLLLMKIVNENFADKLSKYFGVIVNYYRFNKSLYLKTFQLEKSIYFSAVVNYSKYKKLLYLKTFEMEKSILIELYIFRKKYNENIVNTIIQLKKYIGNKYYIDDNIMLIIIEYAV